MDAKLDATPDAKMFMMMLTQDFVESLLDGAIMIAKYSGRDTVSYDDIDQYLTNAWKLHANKHRYF